MKHAISFLKEKYIELCNVSTLEYNYTIRAFVLYNILFLFLNYMYKYKKMYYEYF